FNSATSVTVSFKNESGGALTGQVCSWGTDDTAAIQNAVNQTGTIQLPSASCLITGQTIKMKSNTCLKGAGRDSTFLIQCGQTAVTKPGVVTVEPTVENWAVEDMDIAGVHISGATTAVNPANAGVW